MLKRIKLIDWFYELGHARKDLPYEVTKVFFDNEEVELKESVNISFDHVERVLAFRNLLVIECEDEEELWSDLQAMLDDSSYYSCLAMPLVRQLLEPSTGFMYSYIENKNRIDWTGLPHLQQPKEFLSLSGLQRELASEAWDLACRINEVSRRYLLLSSSKELSDWSKYFLECSASLILLATRFSTRKLD